GSGSGSPDGDGAEPSADFDVRPALLPMADFALPWTCAYGVARAEHRDRTGQKSTGTSAAGASPVASALGPTPSFSLVFFSISSARSGLSLRNFRAFSLPWPSWSAS